MLVRPETFVGRATELALLEQAVERAVAGSGGVVLLTGEPGIGKSRTADEIVGRARAAGTEVLIGRCYEGPGAPPFWPWIQVLRTYVRGRDGASLSTELGPAAASVAQLSPDVREQLPDLPPPPVLDPEQARFRLFDDMTSFLRRASTRRPIVLVLDDLHGADEPSLLLLQFLARELDDMRVVAIGTFRDVAIAREPPLARTVAELLRQRHTEQVTLRGLSEPEVARVLQLALGHAPPSALVAAIYERSEGNPLYVIELVQALARDPPLAADATVAAWRVAIPDGVKAAIARRLTDLSSDCTRLLRLAAVFGREFREDALARAVGGEEPIGVQLEEGLETRAIAPAMDRPGRYRFAHALIRDVLYEEVAPPRRAALHRLVGEALAAVTAHDSEPPLAELAAHFAIAGDPRTIDLARRAGDRAAALLAHEEAAKQYGFALEALDRLSPGHEEARCELLLARGEALRRAGDVAGAKRTMLAAAESARPRGSREQLSRAALGFGAEFAMGEAAVIDEALVGLLEEAVAVWAEEDNTLHARLLARLATSLYFTDVPARRSALCERAVAMARGLGDPEALWYVLDGTHVATWGPGNAAQRFRIAGEMLELAIALRNPRMAFQAHLWRAADSLELADVQTLEVEIAACRRLAEELRDPFVHFHIAVFGVTRSVLAGRFDEADRRLAELATLGTRWWSGGVQQMITMLTIPLSIDRGRASDLVARLEPLAVPHAGSPSFRCVLAYAYAEAGDEIGARREYGLLAARGIASIPRDGHALVGFAPLVEVCVRLADHNGSTALYDTLLPYAGVSAVVIPAAGYFGSVSHYLGMLATVLERWDDARRHFEDALLVHVRMGAAPWVARTQHQYGAMLLARGEPADRIEAQALLTQAVTTAEALGMATLLRRARALLETPDDESVRVPSHHEAIFRLEGDVWMITYDGHTIRLRDMRGLRYLAQLLRAPGRQFHASELVAQHGGLGDAKGVIGEARVVMGLGDAGPALDARAGAAYRRRLSDLREELEEAERLNDIGRAARTRAEIETLRDELAAAARGGRTASHAERARLTVTKGIKAALARIAESHPRLGAHIAATVRRGYFCAYVPDPRSPITWIA